MEEAVKADGLLERLHNTGAGCMVVLNCCCLCSCHW